MIKIIKSCTIVYTIIGYEESWRVRMAINWVSEEKIWGKILFDIDIETCITNRN